MREAIQQVAEEHNTLAERCQRMLENFSDAAESSRAFSERSQRQEASLRTAAASLGRLEGHAPASRAAMQAQADKLAAVMADLAQMELQEEPLMALKDELERQLSVTGVPEATVQREVSEPAQALQKQRQQLQARCAALTQQLQTTIVQSQDLLATTRALEQWLDGTEKRVANLKPLSLNADTLSDQERQV